MIMTFPPLFTKLLMLEGLPKSVVSLGKTEESTFASITCERHRLARLSSENSLNRSADPRREH